MNVGQAIAAIKSLALATPEVRGDVRFELAFGEGAPAIDEPGGTQTPGLLSHGDGIGTRSGLYFFVDPQGELLYIGKATVDNLHHRVWDHLQTPKHTPARRRWFPNHKFKGCEQAAMASIREGTARLAVVTVSDATLTSYFEVYLQTLHFKSHCRLPPLNKRLG